MDQSTLSIVVGDADDVGTVRTERFDAVGRLPLSSWTAIGGGRSTVVAELERVIVRFATESTASFVRLSGPFADRLRRLNRVLWAARDPLGLAPLYVGQHKQR